MIFCARLGLISIFLTDPVMLEKYIKKLSKLRTDKNRKKWSALTCHQAPHKPFLLFSVLDLVAEGTVQKNFIAPSLDLVETFNGYWLSIMPPGTKGNMAYPFPRLKTDGFWRLVPNPGYERKIDMEFSSMTRLRDVCAGAVLDEELFSLMLNPESREILRSTLINTYFAPEIRPRLLEQGSVNIIAHEYSEKLLTGVQEPPVPWEEAEGPEKAGRIRDQGFRKAIVTLYDHRCALCGIRMITPEDHTVVEAAHIKPWRESLVLSGSPMICELRNV